jgi:RNA polymerase sigma-70 factor (ECF subfamily)
MNEIEIIKGCLKNDRMSQKALYEGYYGKMLGVCMRYAKDRDEAKDMLQEGFLKVFNNVANFNNKGSFEGWVRRIMVNTCIDQIRKNKKNYLIVSTTYANEQANAAVDEVAEDDLADKISEAEILRAIQDLTPAYRMVFNLFVIEEYTHKEIAELLDISEGTSKSNLAKAKFNLKKNLIHLTNTIHGK